MPDVKPPTVDGWATGIIRAIVSGREPGQAVWLHAVARSDLESLYELFVRAGLMRLFVGVCAFVLVVSMVARAADPPAEGDKYWPQWRGPALTGAAPKGDPPTEWSESKNIRWKHALGGSGHAAPIIWGERVYVQVAIKTDKKGEPAAVSEPSQRGDGAGAQRERGRRERAGREGGQRRRGEGERAGRERGQRRRGEGGRGQGERGQRQGRRGRGGFGGGGARPTNIYKYDVLALNRSDGSVAWRTTVIKQLPHEGGHRTASMASGSPVTDGEHLLAYFGSRGLFCLDMEGKVLWSKDFGDMRTRMGFGEGSSPALHGDTVVVTWDHEGDSFIIALDKQTGEQRWKVARDEHTSWATPLIVEHDGKAQVIASASNRIRSYDLASGKLIWECGGMTANVIPTPVPGTDLIYAISGFRGNMLQAIRFGEAKGDITDSQAVAWTYDGRGTPYVPSPLLLDDALYFLDNNRAILSSFDARTGKANYSQQRLEGVQGVYASPVGAGGRVYIAGRNGVTAVIAHGPEFKLLATNTLDDTFDASPAIAGKELYLRGHEYLYCIAGE